jgi:hypothetical protein
MNGLYLPQTSFGRACGRLAPFRGGERTRNPLTVVYSGNEVRAGLERS